MESYITAGALALLLVVFWLPVFVCAALAQWYYLAVHRRRFLWLLAALLSEIALAFAIWLSPLSHYLLSLNFLGGLSVGSIPLQAAGLAALVVTLLIWMAGRRVSRTAT